MSAIVKEIKLVKQPTPWSCAHSCLAMVTGVPVQEIIDEFVLERGLTTTETLRWLVRHDIMPVPDVAAVGHFLRSGGTYLVTVPSLNFPATLHMIVIRANSDGFEIYDPSSKKTYDEMMGCYTNVTWLMSCSK